MMMTMMVMMMIITLLGPTLFKGSS